MENGWSIKRLHRQIMLSTAYRQSSRRLPSIVGRPGFSRPQSSEPESSRLAEERQTLKSAEAIDPENRLLWRMNMRRLEAEIVRDSVLTAAGALDLTAGGPPVEITNPADGLSEAKAAPTPASPNRRSIYLFARRVYPLKFLEIFDAPIMPVNCTQRMNSSTVLQSLALLNSEFLFAQADQMAKRMIDIAGAETTSQVQAGFQIAFARHPADAELNRSVSFINNQAMHYESEETSREKAEQLALADFCHMLMSSNEFLYVE
jgi:hypothetical protein